MEEAANLEEAIELFSKSKYAEFYRVIDENSVVCKPCGAILRNIYKPTLKVANYSRFSPKGESSMFLNCISSG